MLNTCLILIMMSILNMCIVTNVSLMVIGGRGGFGRGGGGGGGGGWQDYGPPEQVVGKYLCS